MGERGEREREAAGGLSVTVVSDGIGEVLPVPWDLSPFPQSTDGHQAVASWRNHGNWVGGDVSPGSRDR